MKIAWKTMAGNGNKRSHIKSISSNPNLPFESADKTDPLNPSDTDTLASEPISKELATSFESEGIRLAESGQFNEALAKLESAIALMPDKAKLHEQKAQILLEIGDTWNAIKAATRATELDPAWIEAWITLGRVQLNFGEPDIAIESFDNALKIKADHEEARNDRQAASQLIKRRKQLHLSGLPISKRWYKVGDKDGDKDGSTMTHKSLVPEADTEQQK